MLSAPQHLPLTGQVQGCLSLDLDSLSAGSHVDEFQEQDAHKIILLDIP
jgi:hypothetical protein